MPIRKNPLYDVNNPPGQTVNIITAQEYKPVHGGFVPPKKLGDVIRRIQQEEGITQAQLREKAAYDRGYAEGFIDGKKQGYQDAK